MIERSALRRGARYLVEIGAIFGVFDLVATLLGRRIDVFGIIGLAGAIDLAIHVRLSVREPLVPLRPMTSRGAERSPFERFTVIRERLRWGSTSPGHFDRTVRPLVAEIFDDVMLRRHGIDRRVHPDAARQLVDPDLWAFVTGTSGAQPPTIVELAGVLERIEAM